MDWNYRAAPGEYGSFFQAAWSSGSHAGALHRSLAATAGLCGRQCQDGFLALRMVELTGCRGLGPCMGCGGLVGSGICTAGVRKKSPGSDRTQSSRGWCIMRLLHPSAMRMPDNAIVAAVPRSIQSFLLLAPGEWRDLFSSRHHPRLFQRERARFILSRVRIIAALLAILAPFRLAVDDLLLPHHLFILLDSGRIIVAVAFAILAFFCRCSPIQRHAPC